MREEDRPDDVRRLIAGTLGVLLLLGGVSVAIWVFGVVRQALYQPEEIPLLQMILNADTAEMGFQLTHDDDTFSAHGSRVLVLVVLVAFLMGALGAIVAAMVSGGASLLGGATWRQSAHKRKNPGES
jgi:hypothetical protein